MKTKTAYYSLFSLAAITAISASLLMTYSSSNGSNIFLSRANNDYTINVNSYEEVDEHASTTSGYSIYFARSNLTRTGDNVIGYLAQDGYIKNITEIRGIQSLIINCTGDYILYTLDDYTTVVETYARSGSQTIEIVTPVNYFRLVGGEGGVSINSLAIKYSCVRAEFDINNEEQAANRIMNYDYDADLINRLDLHEYVQEDPEPAQQNKRSVKYDTIEEELTPENYSISTPGMQQRYNALSEIERINTTVGSILDSILDLVSDHVNELIFNSGVCFDGTTYTLKSIDLLGNITLQLDYETTEILYYHDYPEEGFNKVLIANRGNAIRITLTVGINGFVVDMSYPNLQINNDYIAFINESTFNRHYEFPRNPRQMVYYHQPSIAGIYNGAECEFVYASIADAHFMRSAGVSTGECNEKYAFIPTSYYDFYSVETNHDLYLFRDHFAYCFDYSDNGGMNRGDPLVNYMWVLQVEYKDQPFFEFFPGQGTFEFYSTFLTGWDALYFVPFIDENYTIDPQYDLGFRGQAASYLKVGDNVYSYDEILENGHMSFDQNVRTYFTGSLYNANNDWLRTNATVVYYNNYFWSSTSISTVFDYLYGTYGFGLYYNEPAVTSFMDRYTPMDLVSNNFVINAFDSRLIDLLYDN